MWKFQGSVKQGAIHNLICSWKNFICCLWGRGFNGKAVHEMFCLREKDKKIFLHIDLTYYQGNKTCIHTPVPVAQLANLPFWRVKQNIVKFLFARKKINLLGNLPGVLFCYSLFFFFNENPIKAVVWRCKKGVLKIS